MPCYLVPICSHSSPKPSLWYILMSVNVSFFTFYTTIADTSSVRTGLSLSTPGAGRFDRRELRVPSDLNNIINASHKSQFVREATYQPAGDRGDMRNNSFTVSGGDSSVDAMMVRRRGNFTLPSIELYASSSAADLSRRRQTLCPTNLRLRAGQLKVCSGACRR